LHFDNVFAAAEGQRRVTNAQRLVRTHSESANATRCFCPHLCPPAQFYGSRSRSTISAPCFLMGLVRYIGFLLASGRRNSCGFGWRWPPHRQRGLDRPGIGHTAFDLSHCTRALPGRGEFGEPELRLLFRASTVLVPLGVGGGRPAVTKEIDDSLMGPFGKSPG